MLLGTGDEGAVEVVGEDVGMGGVVGDGVSSSSSKGHGSRCCWPLVDFPLRWRREEDPFPLPFPLDLGRLHRLADFTLVDLTVVWLPFPFPLVVVDS